MHSTNASFGAPPTNIHNFADLFTLYRDLAESVRNYEDTKAKIEASEKELKRAHRTVSTAFLIPFLSAISRTLMLAIPWAVLFLIICSILHDANGVKWLTAYDAWYGQLWLPARISELFSPDKVPMWVGIPVTFFRYLVVENLLAPIILFLFPLMFVVSIFTTIFNVLLAKSTIRNKENELNLLHGELAQRFDEISAPISFVPPDYRFSEAIDFFYHAFANGKASTLQEAVLQYDDFTYKRRLEQNQNNILQTNNELLQKLSYQIEQIKQL